MERSVSVVIGKSIRKFAKLFECGSIYADMSVYVVWYLCSCRVKKAGGTSNELLGNWMGRIFHDNLDLTFSDICFTEQMEKVSRFRKTI